MNRRAFLSTTALLAARRARAQPTAASNPRLFFSTADLPGLRQKITVAPARNWYASVKSSATAGLTYAGQDEDARSKYARDMAFVYLMEDGDARRDKVVEFLGTVGDYDTDWSAFGWTWGGDLLYYAMAYDWIRPALSAVEDDAVRARLESACVKTFGRYTVPPITGSDKYYTNVRLRVAAGLGASSLALGSYGNAAARLDWIIEDIFGHTHAVPDILASVVGADGIYKEGSSYQNDSFSVFAPFLIAYRRVTGLDWFAGGDGRYDDRLRKMFRTNIQLMMPSRMAPTVNTGWTGASSMHEIVAGILPDGPLQMWYWNQAYTRSASLPTLSIVCYEPDLDASAAPPDFTSQLLSNAVVFRSGWARDDTWLMMDTSHEPSRSTHDQPDQTSIALYARNAYLLMDPGDGRNYSDARAAWLRSSPVAHNLVTIDGKEGPLGRPSTPGKRFAYASQADNNRDPAPLAEGFTSPYMDYAEAGIAAYYDAPDVGTRRSVFFPNREYIVLLDEMRATSDHTYTQLFHFGGFEGTERIEGSLQLAAGEARWTTKNTDNEAVELRVIFADPAVAIAPQTGYTNLRSGVTLDHTYIRAVAKGSDVNFLTLLRPRKLAEGDAQWKPASGDDTARGGTLIFEDHADVHGLNPGTVGRLSSTAAYAFARASGDDVRLIAMKRGRRVSYGGVVWLESSESITAAMSVEPGLSRVTVTYAGAPTLLRIANARSGNVRQVTFDGATWDFSMREGLIEVRISTSGELIVSYQ